MDGSNIDIVVNGEKTDSNELVHYMAIDGNGNHDLKKCPSCDSIHHFVDDNLDYSIKKISINKYHNSIPKPIREDLSEADTCIELKLLKASSIMLRRAIENICYTINPSLTGSLNQKIEDLLNNYPDLVKIAHEIRIIGNESAHVESKIYSKITFAEINRARSFINTLTNLLFTVPQDIEKLDKKKKSTKKAK